MADIFFKAGYIEAWGRGISKIVESCRAAGLPEPVIAEHAGGLSITFLKDIYTPEYLKNLGLEDRLIQVILFIREKGSITNAMYQEFFSISKRTASRDLQELQDKKLVKKIGSTGKGTSYVLDRI